MKKSDIPPHVFPAKYPAENFDGYIAKVIRTTGSLQKRFSLADYDGDDERCVAAAGKEVAKFVRDHPKLTRRQLAELPRKKKDTDLPNGVRRVERIVKKMTYHFYEASWSAVPNKQTKRKFSIEKYGDDDAQTLAIEARQEGLDEIAKEG